MFWIESGHWGTCRWQGLLLTTVLRFSTETVNTQATTQQSPHLLPDMAPNVTGRVSSGKNVAVEGTRRLGCVQTNHSPIVRSRQLKPAVVLHWWMLWWWYVFRMLALWRIRRELYNIICVGAFQNFGLNKVRGWRGALYTWHTGVDSFCRWNPRPWTFALTHSCFH